MYNKNLCWKSYLKQNSKIDDNTHNKETMKITFWENHSGALLSTASHIGFIVRLTEALFNMKMKRMIMCISLEEDNFYQNIESRNVQQHWVLCYI